jgi:hypothetical protein
MSWDNHHTGSPFHSKADITRGISLPLVLHSPRLNATFQNPSPRLEVKDLLLHQFLRQHGVPLVLPSLVDRGLVSGRTIESDCYTGLVRHRLVQQEKRYKRYRPTRRPLMNADHAHFFGLLSQYEF